MNNLLTLLIAVGGPALVAWPLGHGMALAMQRGATPLKRNLSDQSWREYLASMLAFNALIFLIGAAILSTQQWLPLNPDGRGAPSWHLVFNTAASFTTNTNLQHYSGEVHMSYFSQLFALMWLQFVSAATGIACLAALARGLATTTGSFGNFFLDLQRATFWILLPLAVLVALAFVVGGMPMTLAGAAHVTTLEGALQTIARGPVAAFVAIKQLGTNGGGFFGPNSAHPFENPNFFTNLVSLAAILAIPMACVWMFGKMTGRMKHAAVIFGVMLSLIAGKIAWAVAFESAPTAAFAGLPVDSSVGNLEGKELRFGAITGPLWAVLTTSTSNGSVGAMHDSLNPLTGLAPLVGMWLNATFGGVGVGMINMLIYVVVTVFLAGMMIGRTPEYMGKRVESSEMAMAALCLIAHPLLILGGTALFSIVQTWGAGTIHNPGAHGFTEILYEFSSAAANNGSGYEGLGDNTVPWNLATGLVMLISRYVPIVLPIAIVGRLSAKKTLARNAGSLSADTPTFGVMLAGVISLLGALTFMPTAVLGPIAEHLMSIGR